MKEYKIFSLFRKIKKKSVTMDVTLFKSKLYFATHIREGSQTEDLRLILKALLEF